ncbi:N-acetyltransferase [Sphingomonas gilva]|uniref:N-acetyltransferase n=1 Tax=Sphingomonas gilva TaxID=2305907 RepID=A0A396RMK2_9SPHN|nr:GNAT family N-acetyltransferase [Sphingomonas gilva]RHW17630.1 N-acetyltransferase [Sphingomonas gilva]
MTPVLRPATLADADTLADIGQRSFAETFGHLYRPEDLAIFLESHRRAQWEAELADPGFIVAIAEIDGEAAGYAKLAPPKLPIAVREPAIELRQFYVLSGWQGSGLAARMMDWVIATARERGARDIHLSVFVDNHRARRFYERYGFERVGTYAFMVGGHEDEDDIMRLTLDG